MLLALDTSTRQAGIALYDGERGLIAEYTWYSANRHTEELLPAMAYVLTQARLFAHDLAAVGVALGPGSFTGLRVGLAAAKGLVVAHGLKLIGVPTLDFTAYPHQAQPVPVVALIQAGRGRVYWASYAHGPGGWSVQEPASLASILDVANRTVRPTMFVGEVTPASRQALTQSVGQGRAHFLAPALAVRRPGCLAELAWQRFINGEAEAAASLSPIYLQQTDNAQPAAVGPGGLSR